MGWNEIGNSESRMCESGPGRSAANHHSLSRSPEETIAAAFRLAAGHPGCRAFYLEGGLGAGKTVFAKGLARHYGVDPRQVTSPTFALVQRYGEGTRPLYHLDLYRIERAEELEELGIEEMEEEDAVVIVEWPERLGRFLREDAIRVRLDRQADGTRHIEFRWEER